MKVKYKDKITNEIWVKDCTEVGCKNITSCEDDCLGFIPQREKIEVMAIEYSFGWMNFDDDDEQLGNNGRVLNPDEEAMDLYKGKFLDEFQRGEH